jgi:organic radical activating enzyme
LKFFPPFKVKDSTSGHAKFLSVLPCVICVVSFATAPILGLRRLLVELSDRQDYAILKFTLILSRYPSLLQWIERQNLPGLHDSISITGGEPLLHAPFLVEFLPQLKSLTGLPIYLETGGHRPEQVRMILPYLDSVGMDLKLPSVSGETWWQEHTQFLQLCHNASVEVFVKIIVSSHTDVAELEHSAQLVANVSPEIPVFLQPVTPLELAQESSQKPVFAPTPDQVLTWQADMKRSLKKVRVIPQTHKMLNQL